MAFGRAFQLSYFFSYNKLVLLALVTALHITDVNLDVKKVRPAHFS